MRRKDFTPDERALILQFLLEDSKDGNPKRGKMTEAITRWNSSKRTITRLWAEAKQQRRLGLPMSTCSKKGNPRFGKRIQIDDALIESIELCKKSSIRSLAESIHVTKTVVGRWVKKGMIKAHSSAMKPALTNPNMLERVKFSLQALEYDRMMQTIKFQDMQNTVHIDEKWFYISKGTHKFYMSKKELEPHRTCKSKKFMTKVMFMCAVCRPLFDADGTLLFDGRIGIYPFTEWVPAQRNSRNREAGTLEQKAITSITKLVIKDCVINKIIPDIKAKWPASLSRQINIQQDNAKPHIKNDDVDFRAVASSDGFNIRIVHQPPNSPDTNINDLGWFRTIQSLQQKTVASNIDELVFNVLTAYATEDPIKLNKVFLTLQCCMLEIMRVKGQNYYKVPHIGKDALIRLGLLPYTIKVNAAMVRDSLHFLMDAGMDEGLEEMARNLGMSLMPDLNAMG